MEIEKGIEMPTKRDGMKSKLLPILRTMEVGDSFVYPRLHRTNLSMYFRLSTPSKFATRSISDTEVRVWRVE